MGEIHPLTEIRPAHNGEVIRQKEIWKLCFGDADTFIDFYFENRYKAENTIVLLDKGKISAMLTQIPIRVVTPEQRSLNSAMFYAIATHPQDRHRGFATQIIEFSNAYLSKADKELSVLVPAEKPLFEFYHKLGYQEGFYIRETLLQAKEIEHMADQRSCSCKITPIIPKKYNQRRDQQLKGNLYVAYEEDEIVYQKKISQLSGADIYAMDSGEVRGCAAIERLSSDKVLVKELLIADQLLPSALQAIALCLPAQEYIVRTPIFRGKNLGGSVHPFGMFWTCRNNKSEFRPEASGYLGLAFD